MEVREVGGDRFGYKSATQGIPVVKELYCGGKYTNLYMWENLTELNPHPHKYK